MIINRVTIDLDTIVEGSDVLSDSLEADTDRRKLLNIGFVLTHDGQYSLPAER